MRKLLANWMRRSAERLDPPPPQPVFWINGFSTNVSTPGTYKITSS
jgi:hypothetical protein